MSRRATQQQIGVALRAARQARGITQDELSQVLDIDRSMLARYEVSARLIPIAVIIECGAYFNVSRMHCWVECYSLLIHSSRCVSLLLSK